MRQADENRFREFARHHALPLRRSAYLLCGDWHLAEDLVQATLIKLHGVWPRVDRVHQPVSYARKILLNRWLAERRRAWRRSEDRSGDVPEGTGLAWSPETSQEQAELRAELFGLLAAIAPRQRAVLVLRFIEELSVAETAAALDCSEGTVKSQTAKGLAAIRAALDTRSGAPVLSKEQR